MEVQEAAERYKWQQRGIGGSREVWEAAGRYRRKQGGTGVSGEVAW